MTTPRFGRRKAPISLGIAVGLISAPQPTPRLRPREPTVDEIVRSLPRDIRRGLRLR